MRFWPCLVLLLGCDRLLRLDGITPIDATPTAMWTAVSAGGQHTCGVKSDGTLWCWGINRSAQLGVDGAELHVPTRLEGTGWTAVSAGFVHTCGLRGDGSLWCWGYSALGETGVGNLGGAGGVVATPTQVEGSWTSVSAGGFGACALRGDGSLWCWGDNSAGPVGTGPAIYRPSPVMVPAQAGAWTQVAAGLDETCALGADGSLWCWGDDGGYGLGDGTGTTQFAPEHIGTDTWTSIATGYEGGCGVTGGHLRCWGRGIGSTPTPVTIAGKDADGWIDVSVGGYYATNPMLCARRDDGLAYCWGDNVRGQVGPLGQGLPFVSEPVPLQGGAASYAAISVGGYHTCALGDDASLWCLGYDAFGQLGDGNGSHVSPAQVPGTWVAVSAGTASTCAIDPSGKIECAGQNDEGELGDSTIVERDTLAPVQATLSATQVVAGTDTALAIANDHQLWSWGSTQYGTLGNGTTTPDLHVPATATTPAWKQISAHDHACGVDLSGAAYCWGRNDWGQVGDSSTVNTAAPSPIQTAFPTTWSAIATGAYHTCAIGDTGTYCWGRPDYGQLGVGVVGSVATTAPVAVVANLTFTAITCGAYHSCAIDTTRSAWCWGYGLDGELGVGGLGVLPSATQLAGTTWLSLSAGDSHTCGIQTDGSLWCWGDNLTGQLGDGTLQSRDTPVAVAGGSSWLQVAAGGSHTCAIRADDTLWCWGDNERGQLGDGTAWQAQPVQIP